jgi:hypothetical protein
MITIDAVSHSERMRLLLTVLYVVALVIAFLGAWLAWRGLTQRDNEASKPSTWEDVLNFRPIVFGTLNRESRWGVALVAIGALLNTGLSIWTLFI